MYFLFSLVIWVQSDFSQTFSTIFLNIMYTRKHSQKYGTTLDNIFHIFAHCSRLISISKVVFTVSNEPLNFHKTKRTSNIHAKRKRFYDFFGDNVPFCPENFVNKCLIRNVWIVFYGVCVIYCIAFEYSMAKYT